MAGVLAAAVRPVGGRVFLSEQRIGAIRERIAGRVEPTYSAWQHLEQYVQEHEGHQARVPSRWYVPGFYVDAEGHRRAKEGLMRDANTAYAFALYFRLGGGPEHAQAAAEIVRAWSTHLEDTSDKDDSTLSFSYHFPAMIFAADLLRGSDVWSDQDERDFRDFLRDKALPLNTMARANNWGNWGLVLTVSVAAYLQDEALLDRCEERWKEFIRDQIAEDGHLPHEVRRSGGQRGLWYSHFTLMPQTIAGEVLRVNGVDLFDYVAPNGRSLQMAFARLAAWCRRPETFPYWDGPAEKLLGMNYYSYFELLADRWPDESALALIDASRPTTASHCAPFLTLTHGAWPPQGAAQRSPGDDGTTRDLMSDTWVATDALGRELPGHDECGPVRANRTVGLFYFLWLGQHGTGGPFDITELLKADPHDPAWGPVGAFHHWGQSELGYYLSDSAYVIRKHASMLADAGIDVVIFDVTNAVTYAAVYLKLCEIYRQLRAEGRPTPQICFLTHSSATRTIETLYRDFYAKDLYRELWFYWKGKPLILGGATDELPAEIAAFFTHRDCWAWTHGQDTWQWLDHPEMRYGWHESPDKPEELAVSVAQHPTTNIGRSCHNGVQPPTDEYGRTGLEHLGLYFDEQWQRALKVDPEFVFITGWNEWVAQRFLAPEGGQTLLGRKLKPGESFFVDAYNQEYNRDIEPMKGGHTDNYYYQMVSYIRRYKGVRKPPVAERDHAIAIDGRFDDWDDVQPEFRDTAGDVEHRDEAGWGQAGRYVNATGRNDFVTLKVAVDGEDVCFYAETAGPMTPHTDDHWMLLFIDADQTAATGWHGYDYLVNLEPTSERTTSVHRFADGTWRKVANAHYRYSGSRMEIAIPCATLGLPPGTVAFDFHWADNIRSLDDILEFARHGDSAPNRRFNYRFQR